MPNQRATNKKKLGLWITREEHQRFKSAATARGVSVSELIKQVVDEAFKERNKGADYGER